MLSLPCTLLDFRTLCSWVRASWINVNNCPKRCDYIQFYYISADSSTCFGWYPHPSSGAHTYSNYNIWHWSNHITTVRWAWRSRNSVPTPPRQRTVANTVRLVPDVVITVWMCSWWWMSLSSETCRAVCRNIIKLHIVASCWIIIDIDFRTFLHQL
jgi:hypothetical protein